MRLGLFLLALAASGTMAGVAGAQPYEPDDRGPPPRYDRGPPPRDYDRYDRRDYDRPERREYDRHERREYDRDDRPPQRFVCLLDPSPPYPGRRCETHPGRPGSPCRCNGPYVGHREIDRRY